MWGSGFELTELLLAGWLAGYCPGIPLFPFPVQAHFNQWPFCHYRRRRRRSHLTLCLQTDDKGKQREGSGRIRGYLSLSLPFIHFLPLPFLLLFTVVCLCTLSAVTKFFGESE